MQGRSIRSFALDYYRKQGAEVRPLEGSEAYEIVPTEGPALTVTFTGDAEQPELMPLTATSPQWRAIIEDLTGKVAVSYRYLVTGPIANAAAVLQAGLPQGWTVQAAKLQKVESRPAVGFSHRITFDSPALSACREVIHHHVWDVQSGERLSGIEPQLYELPCILLRPDTMPGEESLNALLAHTVSLIDLATDERGAEIEGELRQLLSDVEKRTNQYYEQQMGNVMAREVQLTEKLDGVIKKLAESKTPEQVARYRQEGESLSAQLAHLKAHREEDLQAIEAACCTKLNQERDRHELTATTDLVALCHATYDVVTYQAQVRSPEGDELTWELRYWPITRELRLPQCPACHGALREPLALGGGRAACRECVATCNSCGTLHVPSADPSSCQTCHNGMCEACETHCTHCGGAICVEHTGGCRTCEAPVCGQCSRACCECAEPLCQHHAHRDPVNGKTYCADHRRPEVQLGALAPQAPQVAVADEVSTAAAEAAPAPVNTQAGTPSQAAVARLKGLTGELRDVEAPAAAVAEAPAAKPAQPVRLVSGLSGRSLNARTAEVCYGCDGHFEVNEMVNCPTCGVPACVPCTEGEEGPCPACERLEAAEVGDARLGFVLTSFPELAEKRRKWAIAEFGPYVVTHWRRMGTWGMVVYHTGGYEPVVVSEFSYGRLETLHQTVICWFGGR